jgi:hypothetical protein
MPSVDLGDLTLRPRPARAGHVDVRNRKELPPPDFRCLEKRDGNGTCVGTLER